MFISGELGKQWLKYSQKMQASQLFASQSTHAKAAAHQWTSSYNDALRETQRMPERTACSILPLQQILRRRNIKVDKFRVVHFQGIKTRVGENRTMRIALSLTRHILEMFLGNKTIFKRKQRKKSSVVRQETSPDGAVNEQFWANLKFHSAAG